MTHQEVIQLWRTHKQLADMLGIARPTVTLMHSRDRIPAKYWSAICEAKPEVDIRDLAEHIRVDMR